MSSPPSLKDLSQEAAYSVWGYVPNRNIKPVHFANKFFRSVSGSSSSPKLLQKAAGGFKRGKSELTTRQFVSREDVRIRNSESSKTVEKAKDLRAALDSILSQDDAFYGKGPYFSPTLTHWRQTTSDPSDQKTGALVGHILDRYARDSTIKRVQNVLHDTDDAIYKLTAPLLQDDGESPSVDNIGRTPQEIEPFFKRIEGTPSTLENIVSGIDRLSKHSERLEKTAFLQRLVTFCGFSIYYHAVNSTMEAREGKNCPLLLCSPSPSKEVKNASRSTFQRSKLHLRRSLEEEIRRRGERRGEEKKDRDYFVGRVENLLERGSPKNPKEKVDQFQKDFGAERPAADSDFEAYVRSVVDLYFEEMGTKDPISSLTYFAKRIGFLGPLRGKGEKYYRSTPQFLDAIVCALLEPDEGVITETEFWERAWKSFGLFSGARRRAALDILNEHGIRGASAGKLRENAVSVRKEMEKQGYAYTYADSATLIEAT
jgi:hypothetical protein